MLRSHINDTPLKYYSFSTDVKLHVYLQVQNDRYNGSTKNISLEINTVSGDLNKTSSRHSIDMGDAHLTLRCILWLNCDERVVIDTHTTMHDLKTWLQGDIDINTFTLTRLDALHPWMIKLCVADISAVLEPSTTASATAEFTSLISGTLGTHIDVGRGGAHHCCVCGECMWWCQEKALTLILKQGLITRIYICSAIQVGYNM